MHFTNAEDREITFKEWAKVSKAAKLPRMERENALRALAAERFDLFIVGGGIVGAGVARDGALRGMKVGLVDANDFAFGTSSRSSRLLHGGIRYLAQGRIALVREASVEKRILHEIAPHLVEPLAFCFPSYRGSQWPLWQLRIGVKVYDLLCGGKNFGKSKGMNARQALQMCPGLTDEGLAGAVRYFDGFTNDARLVIDTLRSAENAGALVVNYARFAGVERRGDEFICQIKDARGGNEFVVKTRAVVNAAGPWAEGLGLSKVKLRLTKGIHLVFDRERLPTTDAVVITQGARILFVLPWGERTIVGTTDTDFVDRPEQARVEGGDVDYLLGSVNEFFPGAKLSASDVVSSYAGVRPLIADPKGRPSDISRTHSIQQSAPGWWDVAGGKLTTYRLMAEQTVDQVAKLFGSSFGKCMTAEKPLLHEGDTKGISAIVPPPVSRELVEHFRRNEWAQTVEDVMKRRTSWAIYRRDAAQVEQTVNGWLLPEAR